MSRPLILPTESEGFLLKQFTTPKDDAALFGLIEKNRQHWSDIEADYPTINEVRLDRLRAKEEHELRLGMLNASELVGWLSLITYDQDDEYGNWLGFWVDKEHTGRGYATSAVRAAIEYVREMPGLNKEITTTTAPENEASLRTLMGAGFVALAGDRIIEMTGELAFKLHIPE